jgi:hypothetical protein
MTSSRSWSFLDGCRDFRENKVWKGSEKVVVDMMIAGARRKGEDTKVQVSRRVR